MHNEYLSVNAHWKFVISKHELNKSFKIIASMQITDGKKKNKSSTHFTDFNVVIACGSFLRFFKPLWRKWCTNAQHIERWNLILIAHLLLLWINLMNAALARSKWTCFCLCTEQQMRFISISQSVFRETHRDKQKKQQKWKTKANTSSKGRRTFSDWKFSVNLIISWNLTFGFSSSSSCMHFGYFFMFVMEFVQTM